MDTLTHGSTALVLIGGGNRGAINGAILSFYPTPDVVHLGPTCHADIPMTDLSLTSEMIDPGYREPRRWLASHDTVRTKSSMS